jgi:predicted small lipoprotein YifL
MNSKHLHALLVSCLLGLLAGSLAGCEPKGPTDVALSAPPNAVSPKASYEDKVNRLAYAAPDANAALKHATEELVGQGFDRCPNAASSNWLPYTFERDGKRVNTMRYKEFLFRELPPRLASVEMLRQAEGVQVTVEVVQVLTGDVVKGQRGRHCSAGS